MKYLSPLTNVLDPNKWQEQINLKNMDVEEMLCLWSDMKVMEAMAKKVNGYMRTALQARLPEGEDTWTSDCVDFITTEQGGRVTYDHERKLEDMGEQFMQKYQKQGEPYTKVQHIRREEKK